jgi:hypothetical protein
VKKLVLALLTRVVVFSALPAMAWGPLRSEEWDPAKLKDLGLDGNKIKWWLVHYDVRDGVPFAIIRKYYPNESVKKDTAELLMSQYGIDAEVADSLYFTEYGYEFSPDGKKFAVAYIAHGSQNTADDYIRLTVTDDANKAWNVVDPKSSYAASKCKDIVVPKAKATKKGK